MDESHPIPKLDVIDIHARRRSGGSDLVIIVASALSADARSVFRLFRKLDSYLREIDSDAYRQEFGEANPESTGIFSNYIRKPGADPTIPRWMRVTPVNRAKDRKDEGGEAVFGMLLKVAGGRGHLD